MQSERSSVKADSPSPTHQPTQPDQHPLDVLTHPNISFELRVDPFNSTRSHPDSLHRDSDDEAGERQSGESEATGDEGGLVGEDVLRERKVRDQLGRRESGKREVWDGPSSSLELLELQL